MIVGKESLPLDFEYNEQTGNLRTRYDIHLHMPMQMPPFIVPKGTVTDGRSAPPWTWMLIGPPIRNKFMRCWLGHDVLCERASNLWERAVADALLGYWLWYYNAGLWTASVHFWGVFLWGRLAFWKRGKKHGCKSTMAGSCKRRRQ